MLLVNIRTLVLLVAVVLCTGACTTTKHGADIAGLEQRMIALEREIAALKQENKQLKESALELLSDQIAQRERENARIYYRTVILPLAKPLADDFGTRGPKFPKEEEINTMMDAYRPVIEMMTQLMSVAGAK